MICLKEKFKYIYATWPNICTLSNRYTRKTNMESENDGFQDRNLFYVSFGGCKHGTSQCLFGQNISFSIRKLSLRLCCLIARNKGPTARSEFGLQKKDAGWYRKGQETPKNHQCCFFIWELDHNFRKVYTMVSLRQEAKHTMNVTHHLVKIGHKVWSILKSINH